MGFPLPQPLVEASCEVRCGCGSLLARQIPEGIELKCRRCRRRMLLAWAEDGSISVRDIGSSSEG